MKIEYKPIGFVHSPHQTTSGTPIQPSRARGIEGTVEIADEYVEALSDLDIKPYVRDFDDQTEVRCGWLDDVRGRETVADDRFDR